MTRKQNSSLRRGRNYSTATRTGSGGLEQKKAIEELQGTLKKAKDEMDINLPAAINRVDLLWHEMGKLIRRG